MYPQSWRTVIDDVSETRKSIVPQSTRCRETPCPDQLRGSESAFVDDLLELAEIDAVDAVLDLDAVAVELAVAHDRGVPGQHPEGAVAALRVRRAGGQRRGLQHGVVDVVAGLVVLQRDLVAGDRRRGRPGARVVLRGRLLRAAVGGGAVLTNLVRGHQRHDGDDDEHRQRVRAPSVADDELVQPVGDPASHPPVRLAVPDAGVPDARAGAVHVGRPHAVLGRRVAPVDRHGRSPAVVGHPPRLPHSRAKSGTSRRVPSGPHGRGILDQTEQRAGRAHRILHHRGVPDPLHDEQP